MNYWKKDNDRIKHDPDKGLFYVITFEDIQHTGEGNGTTGAKHLKTYGDTYVIPDGFETATLADWGWGLGKLRLYVTSLT